MNLHCIVIPQIYFSELVINSLIKGFISGVILVLQNNSSHSTLIKAISHLQHFHATIVIQHVSRNKINFMQLISYNKTCFMQQYFLFCATNLIQQNQFFAKYFMQQKLFHETYTYIS